MDPAAPRPGAPRRAPVATLPGDPTEEHAVGCLAGGASAAASRTAEHSCRVALPQLLVGGRRASGRLAGPAGRASALGRSSLAPSPRSAPRSCPLGSLPGLAPWATGLPPPGLAPRRLPRRRPPRRPRWTERPLRPGSRAERPNRAIRAKAGPGCPKRASPRLWGRRRACLDTTHLHSQTTSGIAGLGVPPSVRSRPSEGLLGRSSATIPHTARPSLPTMGAARGLFSNRACRS